MTCCGHAARGPRETALDRGGVASTELEQLVDAQRHAGVGDAHRRARRGACPSEAWATGGIAELKTTLKTTDVAHTSYSSLTRDGIWL
jgi:hypothetical protein